METIGYIVTGKKIPNIEGFVRQVDEIESADLTKPTLVVGWQLARQFEGYDILDRKLGDNLYWTFSRTENRSEFETDLKKFYDKIKADVIEKIPYKYVDIIKIGYGKAKKLLQMVISGTLNTIYINEGMLYFVVNGTVCGISLSVLEYCGIDQEKVLGRLRAYRVRIVGNDNRRIYRLGRFLGNKKYAIPYFMR